MGYGPIKSKARQEIALEFLMKKYENSPSASTSLWGFLVKRKRLLS